MSDTKGPKRSGRASIPTPPVKFAEHDLPVAKRNSKGNAQQRSRLGWLFAFFSRIGIYYVIFAAVWSCPSRPLAFDFGTKDTRPVCRNIAQTYEQIVPIVAPYVHMAQSKIEPYTQPVIKAVTPFAHSAYKVSRPVVRETTKRSKLVWKKRIDPARKRALKKARKQVQPYVQRTNAYYAQQIQPHINTVQRTVKPYQNMYQHDVAPYVDQAYQYSLQSSSVTYAFYMDKVHPHVLHSLKQVYSFFVNHVDPAVRRAYSLYVRPQVEKLLQKAYERKAHYLGSDAISSAKTDMKHAAQEADAHAKDIVRQAKEDAERARIDPTLSDRLQKAKSYVVGGHQDETDPIKLAQLDAELEVEEAKVKEQLEVWEEGMTGLIEKEYRLAIERLVELRNRRMSDLPDRFGLLNEAFVEDEVALILNRIERGARKLSSGVTNSNRADRTAAAQRLIDQQLSKFDDAAQDTKVQISAFYEELLQQERQTIETSGQELRRFADEAEKAYNKIMADVKFSSIMDEWEGWNNGVKKRASLFSEELSEVQQDHKKVRASSGAPDLRKDAPNVQKDIQDLRKHADILHKSARKEVAAFGVSALAQMAGKGVMAKVSDVTDRISDQASQISTDAAAGMMAAVDSARSRLGLGASEPESYLARAKSYLPSSPLESSVSAGSYVDSLTDGARSAISSASSVVSQASHSVASAVGATPTAEGYVDAFTDSVKSVTVSAASIGSQASSVLASAAAEAAPAQLGSHIESLTAKVGNAIDAVQDSVASAASAGSSALHTATRSAASALGASPTPETFFEYVEAVTESASSAVSVGSSYVSAAASDVSRNVGENVGSVSSAASSVGSQIAHSASSLVGDASSSVVSANSHASSVVSKATRSAKSAVGASPTPETLQDYVEDAADSVSSVVDFVVDAAASASVAATSGVKKAAEQAHLEL